MNRKMPMTRTTSRFKRALHAAALATLACAALTLAGCDQSQQQSTEDTREDLEPPIETKGHLPKLTFSTELRALNPDVAVFVDEFLQTCLVGDYLGYRRMVGRAFEPETRERFEGIHHAITGVTVESIEELDLKEIPPPVYLVISTVELDPKQQVKLRESHRKVSILVFKEDDEWKMAPAPSQLQPREEREAKEPTEPTSTAPAYPWDESGDY